MNNYMLKKRKAQQLSITVMILLVLGIIVLVVVLAIFGKESGRTVSTLESCGARGGNCVDPSECTGGTRIPEICTGEDKICCVNI